MERLKDLQEWMRTNGESLRRIETMNVPKIPNGYCTRNRNIVYVNLFERPESGVFYLSVGKERVASVVMLKPSGKDKRPFRTVSGKRIAIALPVRLPFRTSSVLKIEFR